MKPLSLRMQAFGPYGGIAEVDFTRLADVGLFVVSGPTGAGKTSIFDAMTYALFGDLPGERSGFSELRSDHAPLDLLCEVEFLFEAGGKRWRATRVPTQERAKKRGTGTAKEQAKASLDRLDGGEWVPVSSSVRDVSVRCGELVGLNADQFQRVVLLPQGQFQQVLKAKSAERRELLRTLFSSSLYSAIEIRLKERASEAELVLVELGRQQGNDLEVASQSILEAVAVLEAQDRLVDPEPTLEQLELLLSDLRDSTLADRTRQLERSEVAVRAATAARQQAEAQVRALERLEKLEKQRDFLAAQTDQFVAARVRAERAERARPVAKLSASMASLTADAGAARDAALRLAEHVAEQGQGAGIDTSGIAANRLVVEARSRAGTVAEATRRALEQLTRAQAARLAADTAAVAYDNELVRLAGLENNQTQLNQQQDERRASVASLETAAAGVERCGADLADAAERLDFARRLQDLVKRSGEVAEQAEEQHARKVDIEARRTNLEPVIEGCRERSATREARMQLAAQLRSALERRGRLSEARQVVLSTREQLGDASKEAARTLHHFESAASPRLASALVDGEPCMVCGSTAHPDPATAESAGAALADLDAVEETQANVSALVRQLGEATANEASLLEALGDHGEVAITELEDQIAAADNQVADAEQAKQQLMEAQNEQLELRSQLKIAITRLATIEERHREIRSDLAHLEGALGADASLSIGVLVERATAAETRLADARASIERLAVVKDEIQLTDQALTQGASNIALAQQAKARHEQTKNIEAGRADEILVGIDGTLEEFTSRGLTTDKFLATVERLDRAQRASTELEVRLGTLSTSLSEALADSEFDSVEEALQSVVEPAHQRQLQASFDEWETNSAQVAAAIEEVRRVDLPEERPNIALLAEAERLRGAEERRVRDQVTTAELHLKQAAERLGCIRLAEAEVAETRIGAQHIKELADICSGNGPTRRSLESWVLAAHLRDVVELANKHLAPMSGGRYELIVADEPDDRRREAGLDLTVLDARSGKPRPVASLSGGETFQASLALALGLADVVSANRGGVQIDALFVDEGFGSLDAESLDHAIDVLDGLRSRGALVGVITHVEAMKQALQVGIEVERDPAGTGSRLTQLV